VNGLPAGWIDEHYEFVGDPRAPEPPAVVCRRCHAPVSYLTKHAVVRHHDPIRILPVVASKLGLRSVAIAF
jgi:hypothetical protein